MAAAHSSAENSPSTAATTPELAGSIPNDDIWGSDDETSHRAGTESRNNETLLSDLPVVRRQHMTDGYREGLGIGKARIMQKGFDQGYPVGIRIGLRAGKVLGLLEGVVAAKGTQSDAKTQVQKLLDRARQELIVSSLMKDINDEQLMASSEIPATVEAVLRKWESIVVGDISDKSESESL